jgi:hypothetical protein
MKIIHSILFLAILLGFGSCSTSLVMVKTNPNGKVPPGQMKKATGARSAKSYAPGQQKKHH